MDWSGEDFTETERRKRGKGPAPEKGRILRPEEGNATVAEIFPNQSAVRMDGEEARLLCRYRMTTLSVPGEGRERERSPVCVGDRVRVEASVIVGRCERRNRLVRAAPDSSGVRVHVLAANVDFVVVVAAARAPDFSAGIVDRFLVAASAQKIQGILCVNKTDLIQPGDEKPWACYPSAGVPVVELSARSGEGVGELAALVIGKTAVFCGHSGVGKTSLLRKLLGDEKFGRVAEVKESSGMGRHTTTGAVLLPCPDGSVWIDTPGIMNFGLIGVGRGDLLTHFPELFEASARCPQHCGHADDPECVLRGMPRFGSYRSIWNSL